MLEIFKITIIKILIVFSISHITYAIASNDEIITDRDDTDISTVTFRSNKYLFKLIEEKEELKILTEIFSANNTKIHSSYISLKKLIPAIYDYHNFDLSESNSYLYILVNSYSHNIEKKHNILFRSNDGIHWKLIKHFPSKWQLGHMTVNNNIISIGCANCSNNKPSYVVSTNSGKTWRQHKRPKLNSEWMDDNSYIINNKLFVTTYLWNGDSPGLLSLDTTQKNPVWKNHSSTFIPLTKEKNNSDIMYFLETINNIYIESKNILIKTTYLHVKDSDDLDTNCVRADVLWVSSDSGKSWAMVGSDLKPYE